MIVKSRVRRAAGRTSWLVVPALVLLVALFVLPLAVILEAALFEEGTASRHFSRFLASGLYVGVMQQTVITSLVVATLSLAAGYPIAFFISRQPPRTRAWLIFLILVPLWMSILVRTYAWMIVLGREGVINASLMALGFVVEPLKLNFTTGSVYIVMVQVLLPLMVMTCYAGMAEIDDTFMRAARVLGARPSAAFMRVFLPLSLEGAVSGFVLVFMLSMGFFIVPALVGGPKDAMIANLIATQVEQANWAFAAALALILLAVTLLVMMLIRLATRRLVFSFAGAAAAS
jgi:putative spermidine/putrescine transport system permease protein